jgi:hypothetical protein
VSTEGKISDINPMIRTAPISKLKYKYFFTTNSIEKANHYTFLQISWIGYSLMLGDLYIAVDHFEI